MKKRDSAIDLIKAFAIICVICVHVSAGVYSAPEKSLQWAAAHIFGSVSRAGVPLFLMCSGALFLDEGREITVKKLFSKNIPRIAAAMFFWAFVYKIYHLEDLGYCSLVRAVKEIFLFKQEFHLYYLHMILLVYVILPVVKMFTKSANEKMLRYALAVWFVLGVLYPTFAPFAPLKHLSGIPLQWKLNMTYSSVGYFLLGYYLKKHPPKASVSAALTVSGFVITYFGTALVSFYRQSLYMGFLEGMTLGTCLLSVGMFSALQKFKRDNKVITYISKASFCIYLSHMLVLYALRGFGVSSMPLLVILVFLLSIGIYFIISHIMFLNKWIV